MTVQVNGQREAPARTGAYALSTLASPLDVFLLRALGLQPASLAELRQAAGGPPQTTVRKHLAALADRGIVSKGRGRGSSVNTSYGLNKAGRDLLGAATVVDAWLADAPSGPSPLGTVAAKSAIKALVDSWSTGLLRALAARPLTLTQLDALISGISYPSLERRLAAMRIAGQVEPAPAEGRGTPYAVTDWLRRGVGPLVSAVSWERRHLPARTPAIGRIDVEAAFLLALPLLVLDASTSGVCRLGVETSDDRRHVGAMVGIEEGRVAYCRARLEGDVTARATGAVSAWLRALRSGHADELEIAGDRELVGAILDALRAGVASPAVA